MTLDLLADNLAAHWMQAGALAGAAWLGVAAVRLRQAPVLLRCWQGLLLLLLLLPWIQPWHPAAPPGVAMMNTGVAVVHEAPGSSVMPASSSLDLWAWLLPLLAAGAVVRLAWIAVGAMRLG